MTATRGTRTAESSTGSSSTGKLQVVGQRPPFGRYLAEVWRRRAFIVGLAGAQLRAVNGQDRLGSMWLVLTPMVNGAVYFLIFGLLLNTKHGVPNFIGYLVVGVFLFSHMTRSVTNGSKAVSGNRKLLQALAFPRAVLPLAEAAQQAVTLGLTFVAMLVFVLLAPPLEHFSWRWLLVLPVLALQVVFVGGLTMLFARLVAGLSDVANMLSFGMRGWLYMSGVFYAPTRFDHHPLLHTIFELNPGYAFLALVRDLIIYDRLPPGHIWLVAAGWAVAVAVVGMFLFWRAEETYARD
ncbi:MAG TPA: ABC transporter permease [Mycobacteriales bacterium]